jgi:hypothetical protein
LVEEEDRGYCPDFEKALVPTGETSPNDKKGHTEGLQGALEEPLEGTEGPQDTVIVKARISRTLAEELIEIVNYVGIWNSLAELVRYAVGRERDKRIREALRKKKEAESE